MLLDPEFAAALGAGLLGRNQPGGFIGGVQQQQSLFDTMRTREMDRRLAQSREGREQQMFPLQQQQAQMQLEAAQRQQALALQQQAAMEQAAALLQPNQQVPMAGAGMSPKERAMSAAGILAPYDQSAMKNLLESQIPQPGTYSKEPTLLQDESGNLMMGQMSGSGGFVPLDLPKGYKPVVPLTYLNTGPTFEPRPTKGAVGSQGPIAKGLAPSETPEHSAATKEAQIIGEQRGNIEGKISALESVREARKMLDSGIYSGFYGDIAKTIAKANPMQDKNKVVNTEAFLSHIGNVVIPRLEEFGGNDSNEEMKYLQRIMGGDISLEPETLSRILELAEIKIQRGIDRINKAGAGTGQQPSPAAPKVRKYNPTTGKIE